MVTDKGLQRQWLWEAWKVEDPQCVCDGWTAQNVVHLQRCPWVGNGQSSRCGKMRNGAKGYLSSLLYIGGIQGGGGGSGLCI